VTSARHELGSFALATAGALVAAALLNRYAGDALRVASASFAAALLRIAGYPVVREEMTLVTSWGRYDVLLPCSGGKLLAATLAIGALLLAGSRAPGWRKAAVAVGLVPLALAGNAWRVAALVWSGGPTSGLAHTMLGILAFSVIALILGVAAGGHSPRT
jgi:exosortase/archaeosortase family protein